MIIGLIPGAMKPYHAGHHFLVEKALSECEHVIVFTTIKDRKGISGINMKQAWEEIILPVVPVEVRFVTSPVGAVYKLLEPGPETKNNQYRIYGGTEDLSRFSSEMLQKYCDGTDVCNVAQAQADQYLRGVGESPMAKGEWVRKAIEEGNFQAFKNFLPNVLKPLSEEYLQILKR
tara:strand:+ start:4 stop:528 length:525 start_codon:yes stop_codon:yes gene_type:complete